MFWLTRLISDVSVAATQQSKITEYKYMWYRGVSASCFKSSDQIKKRLHDYDQVKGLCQICGKIHLSPMIDCVDVMSQRNVESIVKALVLNLFWLADPLGLYFEHKVPYIKADAN